MASPEESRHPAAKRDGRAEPERRHAWVAWRIYLLVGTVGLLIAATMGYSLHTAARMTEVYVPLADAAMEIKLEATIAHLWFEEILSGDRHEDIESVWRHVDQSEWYARAMLEGGQNPEGTFIPLKDASLRRDVEDVLEKIERYRSVMQQRYAAPEKAAAGTAIDQHFDDVFKDLLEQADRVESKLQHLVAGEMRGFRAVQSVLIVVCIALTGVVAFVLQRYERGRALAFSEDYINSLPGLFYVFDERRFVRWNNAWEKVTGYSAEELGSRYGTDFFEGEDRTLIEERMGKVFREGAADAEAELVTKDGRRIPYFFTGSRREFNGKLHLVGLGIDITDLKRAESIREKLIGELEKKNAELERFTYTVSHDLKSPLVTIKGFLGLLEKDVANRDFQRIPSHFERISTAADRMRRLLDELLELSRIGRIVNPPQPVSLAELARETVDLLVEPISQRNIEVEIAPDLPVVSADRARLQEVIQNLVENALRFMGDQPRPRIEIGVRHDPGEAIFFVRDNGIGIPPEYHERIFGLFDQLDPELGGTGIGLAIVKRIVEVHGGRVWVESVGAGCGSTFCFTVRGSVETRI